MLMKEMKAAEAAKPSTALVGEYPPPMTMRPPTAVMPEIAFVTDIKGEWRAGTTDHTVWDPQMQLRPKMALMVVKAELGAPTPKAVKLPSPAVYMAASFM